MKTIKLYFRFLSAFLVCNNYSAQTTVNAYAKVTSVTGSSVLALSNVNIANHTFTVGGQVLVMQMQDDVIGTNTTNASTFGNLSAIANAGIYEIRTISAVTPTSGTPTSVTITPALANTFNTGANSAVQLVSFRDLGANYTTTANISGLAWNGNVGGVVAFYVTNTLTLEHRILADALGFRGGAVSANAAGDLTCVNTSYTSTLTTLGSKGEGIYLATATAFARGRGKILNGGGGGSENNAGGGGGGNYTAGGDGGLGYPCTAANSGRGLGGLSLSGQISASRLFMGGGGGGGQANNTNATAGGNGGGIILIKANTIATSTNCGASISISANGATAANSGNDGSGGGGAGGSIIIQAGVFSVTAACPLTTRANAGAGGSVTNAASHGGGGGGGQGAIIYSSVQPTVNVTTQTNNGAAGSDNSGGTTNAGAGGGTNGSGIIASSSGPLPIELISFKAESLNKRVRLMWTTASEKNNDYYAIERTNDGIHYSLLTQIKGAGSSHTLKTYETFDNAPFSGVNYYRLKQVDFDGSYEYSHLISVQFEETFDVLIYPNPLTKSETLYFKVDKNFLDINTEVIVYDISGKIILHEAISLENTQVFSLKNLNLVEGVYFVKVQNASSSQTKKLLIQP